MSVTSRLEALPRIRGDLKRLRVRRQRALLVYLALLAVFTAVLYPGPSSAGGEHDLMWSFGLVGLFVGAAASTALAIGVPLVHGAKLWAALGVSLGLMLGGLLAALDYELGADWGHHGAVCFTFGTVVSSLFMVILGALSARLWRRFPDPGAMIAFGTTAVGMLGLHLQCPNTHVLHVLAFHLSPLALLYAGARALTRFRLRLLEDRGQD